MSRLLQEENITSDMADGNNVVAALAIRGSARVSVTVSPAHVDTTGWSLMMWFLPRRGSPGLAGRFKPDSLDVQHQVVSGTGLPARIKASTQQLNFDNPNADYCYPQVYGLTGAIKSVDLIVTAED